MAYVVGHCRARVVVVEQDLHPMVEQVRDQLPHLEHVIVVGAGGDSTYDDLLAAEGVDLAEAAQAIEQGDLATVVYTSGTTGPPKGVMIDHRNVLHQVAAVDRLWDTTLPEGEHERRLSFLPMAHIAERGGAVPRRDRLPRLPRRSRAHERRSGTTAGCKQGMDLVALAADEDVRAEVAAQLEAVNARFSQVERVKRFALLSEEWLPDTEVLTPTMKLKRRGVHGQYADVIAGLYA